MAVTLKVTGNGHFQGSATNLAGYSVTEDATPVNLADTTGGVGQFNFTVVEDPGPEGTILLLNDTVELEDGSNGRTTGTVKSVSSSDGIVSIIADSRLSLLVAERTMPPFTGTLGNAIRFYLNQTGIFTGLFIDDSLTQSVTLQGWQGNVWDYIKQLMAVYRIEISLVSNNIVVRPIRLRTAEVQKYTTVNWAAANAELAQEVEVAFYNNQFRSNSLVYPSGGWDEDVQVYAVDAGQTLEIDLPVDVSLQTLQQPIPVLNVARDYVGPDSVYAIAGNDGLPIPPAQWSAGGGNVSVAIGDDGNSIKLTIVGSSEVKYAPYRLAVMASASDGYSALRLVGSGVFYDRQTVVVPTGVPPTKTATKIGTQIDSVFVNTRGDAYDVARAVAGKYCKAVQTLSITASIINRKGESGQARYPTFADFNADWPNPATFAQFNATWTGRTFRQLNEFYFAKVADSFENQAFGNVNGARVPFRQAYYRINSATVTESEIKFSATTDTTIADYNKVWANPATFADVNARYVNKTFEDIGVIPLWR